MSNKLGHVTILILIDGFLQYKQVVTTKDDKTKVTILILIDGFLQYKKDNGLTKVKLRHNPYFNRWFSAIYTIHKGD